MIGDHGAMKRGAGFLSIIGPWLIALGLFALLLVSGAVAAATDGLMALRHSPSSS